MASLLKVAVVGCGAISGNHIRGIQAAGQEICALCDIDLENAKSKAETYGLESVRFYTDYESMLNCERLDAVHICTPHHLHAPMVIAALERNVHVLCEKPLCISLEQLRDVQAAANRSEAQLGVCHQNRYLPNMIRLKELCRGRVKSGFGSVIWHRDEAYYRSAQWRGTLEQEGGGVLINQALHTLDLMQWICGFPESVIAHTHNDLLQGVIEVEDTATACFACGNDVRYQFFATNSASADLPIQIQIKLDDGSVLEAQRDWLCLNGQPIETAKESEVDGKAVWGVGHRGLISDFYDCIQTGRRFELDAEEAGKVIRLILAVYASNGRKTDILI